MSISIKERFESKYKINPETGCWGWTAGTNHNGYGQFWVDGKMVKAHRLSYELYTRPIPEGMKALHTCVGNRKCVNPDHLYLDTQKQNMVDKVNQNRQSRTGPKVPARQKGSDHGNYKLTELQVLEIRELYTTGNHTQAYLAKMFGVGQTRISFIVNLKSWAHVCQKQSLRDVA